jgi:hypothetical protein
VWVEVPAFGPALVLIALALAAAVITDGATRRALGGLPQPVRRQKERLRPPRIPLRKKADS